MDMVYQQFQDRVTDFYNTASHALYPMLDQYESPEFFVDAVLRHERGSYALTHQVLDFYGEDQRTTYNDTSYAELFDTFEGYLYYLLNHSHVRDNWIPSDGSGLG